MTLPVTDAVHIMTTMQMRATYYSYSYAAPPGRGDRHVSA